MTDLGRRDALRLLSAQGALVGLTCLLAGCSSESSTAPATDEVPNPRSSGLSVDPRSLWGQAPEAAPSPAPPASTVFPGESALLDALGGLNRGAKVAFGVGVEDGRTGRRFIHDPGGAHETASTVKVDLLVGLLMRAERAGRELTSSERRRTESMIRVSDNAAADALWAANSRAAGMSAMWDSLGMASMHPGPSGRWGLTTTSVEDRLRLLGVLVAGGSGLPAERAGYALSLMNEVTASQRWGVGAVAGPDEVASMKNGWLPRPRQGWIVSTTGRLSGPTTDLRLAVLSHGHASQGAGIAFVEDALATARQQLGV